MKKIAIAVIALVATAGMYSFTVVDKRIDNIFNTLGIPESDVNIYVWKSIASNRMIFPAITGLKNYPASKRAEALREIASHVKAYFFTSGFNKQYQRFREQHKPAAPASINDRKQKLIEEYTISMRLSEQAFKNASKEMKAVFETSTKTFRQYLDAIDNIHDPLHAKVMEGVYTQYDYDMGDYLYRLKEYEKEYPADVIGFIKLRLKHFLAITQEIDFNAAVIEINGKKQFVRQEFETKPAIWKACYRAGKTSTETAREIASDWMLEL